MKTINNLFLYTIIGASVLCNGFCSDNQQTNTTPSSIEKIPNSNANPQTIQDTNDQNNQNPDTKNVQPALTNNNTNDTNQNSASQVSQTPNNKEIKTETDLENLSNENTNINNNEQEVRKVLENIILSLLEKKSYRLIANNILPLWDRTVQCCIKDKLVTEEKLISIWQDLDTKYHEQINNHFNNIKTYDSDFNTEIFNSKVLVFSNAKNFITSNYK